MEVSQRLKARRKHEGIQRAKFGEKLKKVNERLQRSIDVVVERIMKQAKVDELTARDMLWQIIESQLFTDEFEVINPSVAPQTKSQVEALNGRVYPRDSLVKVRDSVDMSADNVANVLEKPAGFNRDAWSTSNSSAK